MSESSIKCTGGGSDEKVSCAEKEILNTLVKGIYDVETREEVLLKDPQMDQWSGQQCSCRG